MDNVVNMFRWKAKKKELSNTERIIENMKEIARQRMEDIVAQDMQSIESGPARTVKLSKRMKKDGKLD
jgi:hypothetical protein